MWPSRTVMIAVDSRTRTTTRCVPRASVTSSSDCCDPAARRCSLSRDRAVGLWLINVSLPDMSGFDLAEMLGQESSLCHG